MCRVDGLQQANGGELPPSGGPSAHTFWRISLSSSSSNSAKAGLFSFARAFPSFHAKKQIYGTGFMMETLLNVNVVKGVLGALGPSVLTVLTLTSRCFSVLESSSTRNNSPRRPVCPVKARLVDGAWQGLWRVGFCRTDWIVAPRCIKLVCGPQQKHCWRIWWRHACASATASRTPLRAPNKFFFFQSLPSPKNSYPLPV